MSTTYGVMPTRFREWFDTTIHSVAWQQSKYLSWFMGFPGTKRINGRISGKGNAINGGLMRSLEEGLENVITWKWSKMAPGQIAGSLQEAPIQKTNIEEDVGPLMYLATRIAFSVTQVDAWRHNKMIAAGELIPQAIRQAMLPLTNQVDEYICYGDDFKTPLAFDRLGAIGKFKGLFNGFTTFRAGITLDDDLGTKGDYLTSYITARSALRNAGFDTGPYYILSDEVTQANFESGTHLYTAGTKLITGYSAFMGEYKYKQGQVADWIESVNANPGSNTTLNRICVTQPYISQQGRKLEPAYLLYMGYNFKVWPLWAGGLNSNAEYEFLIGISLRLQEINSDALQRSRDNLTFTG